MFIIVILVVLTLAEAKHGIIRYYLVQSTFVPVFTLNITEIMFNIPNMLQLTCNRKCSQGLGPEKRTGNRKIFNLGIFHAQIAFNVDD